MKPPARLFKGYQIQAPYTRVFRERITCEQAECPDYVNGWMVPAQALTAQHWADIRRLGYSWKRFDVSASERYIAFEAGQRCFRADTHTRLVRDPLFIEHKGAKWGPRHFGDGRQHTADTWVDSFATHQDKLADEARRG